MPKPKWKGTCWACGREDGDRRFANGRRSNHRLTVQGPVTSARGKERNFQEPTTIEVCNTCYSCWRRHRTFARKYTVRRLDPHIRRRVRQIAKAGFTSLEIARALQKPESTIRLWLSQDASTRS